MKSALEKDLLVYTMSFCIQYDYIEILSLLLVSFFVNGSISLS